MTRKHALLASTLLGGFVAFGSPAFAQPPADPARVETIPAAQPPAEDSTVDTLVLTGSRIPKNEFTSASPVQVITTESADARGVADTAQFIQSSTIAAGSPQNNATISSAFVTDGGPGSSTISLRGLGANRTLVLLNGRRAGPAGTRGGVSAVDLNVLPQSAISRVDILKDGASSIYGSDAVAGVVNIITESRPDGGEISAFYTEPLNPGGIQMNLSGSWGKTFDRGHFSVSADYYQQRAQTNGQRYYTQCAEQVLYSTTTGERADRVDPRTGSFSCLDNPWGHVWVYGSDGSGRSGRFQFDYDGDLGTYIPTIPPASIGFYPDTPAGFFLVGNTPANLALQNSNHPFEDAESLIPGNERTTVFLEGAYELGSGAEVYAELLLNRRESRTTGYRQYWTYNFTEDWNYFYGTYGNGDPFSTGWTGEYLLSPTPVTDHAKASQKVDYTRLVLGFRGDVEMFAQPWHWDIYGQYSRSKGLYTNDVILQDAIDSQSFRTASCVGSNLPVSGRPCIDIDFNQPAILRGDLTQQQRDFLFDTDTGETIYTQSYIEGFVSGNPFTLPAGDVGVAVGFNLRRDQIVDTPGPITRVGNSWGLSSAGITQGVDNTSEVFGELALPLLRDRPGAKNLNLTVSGRYTDVQTTGSAGTYKVGLNWDVTPQWKLRATHGTSFRAPALFELYLADQTDFVSQRAVDPCINWADALANGRITQRVADNCANPLGPGGGVPNNHTGSGSEAEVITSGGLGNLKPETSTASVFGIVWRPTFADISFAVDYFKINIKNEVTNLGAVGLCYNSPDILVEPICSTFDRNPGTHRIDEIRSGYINVSSEENEGVDFTIRYRRAFPWGDLISNTQLTYQISDVTEVFVGNSVDNNGTIGYPQWVGSNSLSFKHDNLTLYWNVDYVGEQSDVETFGSSTITIQGTTYNIRAKAEAKFFHSFSAKVDYDTWSFLAGVSNVFDERPPVVTTVSSGLGEYNTIGYSALTSNYTEGYFGRRLFARISKKF